MVQQSDRIALGEAKRIFTNSKNVQDRLWSSLRLSSDVLYHPSPIVEALLPLEPGPYGDAVVFPSRLEGLKQSLVVEAMRHVKTGVRLVLVGSGPDEEALESRSRSTGSRTRSSSPAGSRTSACTGSTSRRSACTTGRSTRTTGT